MNRDSQGYEQLSKRAKKAIHKGVRAYIIKFNQGEN